MYAALQSLNPTADGSAMGWCNLATRSAQFTWYRQIIDTNLTSDVQVLYMNATTTLIPTAAEEGTPRYFDDLALHNAVIGATSTKWPIKDGIGCK